MGFCGVDDSVDVELLELLSSRYDWIEWGILFREDLQGSPRYASQKWIENLVDLNNKMENRMNLAAHLCMDKCQDVLNGDATFVHKLVSYGFRRIQINATLANGVVFNVSHVQLLRNVILSVPDIEFILQWNSETEPLFQDFLVSPPKNVSILFDTSCGKGVTISVFPMPFTDIGIHCGYAGGISEKNISDVLSAASNVVKNDSFWVDMESSLRVITVEKLSDGGVLERDIFSVDKCIKCIHAGSNFRK